jgi:branched-chain amino acid transport system ATP-binding protein
VSYFRAENLSLHFGGLKAVDAVSFVVEKGEILSIIGPNGAGKSSIFNLISRIYRPTSGRIYFEDQDITEEPAFGIAKLGIARTFQNIELFENATVLSNLLVGRHRHSPPGCGRNCCSCRACVRLKKSIAAASSR